jgi:hypothetical protein
MHYLKSKRTPPAAPAEVSSKLLADHLQAERVALAVALPRTSSSKKCVYSQQMHSQLLPPQPAGAAAAAMAKAAAGTNVCSTLNARNR